MTTTTVVRPARTPGFYPDIPEAEYHTDTTSLSVSGAKVLLDSPATYLHQRTHPVYKDVFDFGSAAHQMVLGAGPRVVAVDADSWRTKDAQAQRDAIRAAGDIPVLAGEYATVEAMADALTGHRLASQLFAAGQAEVSAYCPDPTTEVMRRARFDWLGEAVITDYKTAASANPRAFARAVATYGYHMQAAWYLDLAADLGHPALSFAFVVQEKTPPYLVTVVELDDAALARGRELNGRALQRYRDCTATGLWPGYVRDDQHAVITLPRWAYMDTEDQA